MPKQKTLSNEANILLEQHLTELGLKFQKEYAFALPRKWRFDYVLTGFESGCALLRGPVAIEIEGGVWQRGRHQRPVGFQNDLIKYREGSARGYRIFRFSTAEVLDGTVREFIREHCL